MSILSNLASSDVLPFLLKMFFRQETVVGEQVHGLFSKDKLLKEAEVYLIELDISQFFDQTHTSNLLQKHLE